MLNYPINTIHLVFDSWKIFLVEKKCVDSLTPLISTGVTLHHLLQTLSQGKRGMGSWAGGLERGSMLFLELWTDVPISCVLSKTVIASWPCSVHSGCFCDFLGMLEHPGAGKDSLELHWSCFS